MPMQYSPEERSERARHAARMRWKTEDPAPNAARGQAGLLARFEREADPEGELPPDQRRERAIELRRDYLRRIGTAAAAARRTNAGGTRDTAAG